jgi:seryl-tRNA synthetase
MANLYEITREAQELAFLLETDELTPELEQMLVINQEQLQAKAGNYAKVIANIQSDSDAIDQEIKRLKAMKESKDRAITRLKDAVREAMLVSTIDKIESPLFKLSLRRSESVEVDIVEALPSQFVNIKNVVTADKVAIKEAIKRGENITGARIIENFNLQIK